MMKSENISTQDNGMREIDIATWHRREIYEFFSQFELPYYKLTTPIKITPIKRLSKANNVSFYHLMIWVVTKAINTVPNFRIRKRNGKLYQLPQINVNFTAVGEYVDTFKCITLDWEEDFFLFTAKAKELCESQKTLFDGKPERDDLIYFTCATKYTISSYANVRRTLSSDDLIPRIVWDKVHEKNGDYYVNLSLEANHTVIDGYHIAELIEAINREVELLQL